MPVPLTEATLRRVEALFRGDETLLAARLLTDECGSDLPFCADLDAHGLERIRFAALKLSDGRMAGLREAVLLAKRDWRDLLMAAGFAHDTSAHERWVP